MTTTWCAITDVQAILSTAGATAALDDDETGSLSAGEIVYGTNMIELAAVEMNASLERQYKLADLASNGWCKWANAVLAAMFICGRRTNPVPQTLADWSQVVRDALAQIMYGRMPVPEANPSFEDLPTVSVMTPVLGANGNPMRVDTVLSTGTAPVASRKRNVAAGSGGYY